jgi:hypothetical protein
MATNNKRKNIGGSILSSSSPHILQPMPFKSGILQVRPIEKEDTHTLVFVSGSEVITLASHPNGFSCHALAERMIRGEEQRTREQAEYIIRCGGTAHLERIYEVSK